MVSSSDSACASAGGARLAASRIAAPRAMPERRPDSHSAASESSSSASSAALRKYGARLRVSTRPIPSTGTSAGQLAGASVASGPITLRATRRSAPA